MTDIWTRTNELNGTRNENQLLLITSDPLSLTTDSTVDTVPHRTKHDCNTIPIVPIKAVINSNI